GYVPVITYSAHWIGHEAVSRAVQRFLEQENRLVEDEARIITQHSPYRTPDLS
ncbi:MAG: GNAT family N-acetyltransferase, partial [Alphaproteobacteria bacterium]|nr:GNAT family N-acetyltransferase [Alphaproteobacteria bacterium]